jgi:hypothetical protein
LLELPYWLHYLFLRCLSLFNMPWKHLYFQQWKMLVMLYKSSQSCWK